MNYCTAEELIAFEDRIKALWEEGELPYLVHLCGGNEKMLVDIFRGINEGDWIFSTHRAHYHALLAGIPKHELEKSIVDGDSMFIFNRERRFLTSSVLAGTCCIANGVARMIKDTGGLEHVWCFLGDGAADQGHYYEAVMYATGHDLPITFVLENNNQQVDTDIPTRRGKRHEEFQMKSPKIFEYRYTATYPHAGSGCAHKIEFKRKTA